MAIKASIFISRDENGWYAELQRDFDEMLLHTTGWSKTEDEAWEDALAWAKAHGFEVPEGEPF